MKILIAVFTYYPERNGVQIVTQYQAEGLAKLGHDVTVLTNRLCDQGNIFKDTFKTNKTDIVVCEEHEGVKILRYDAFTDLMIHVGNKKEYQNYICEESKKYDVMMFVYPQTWCTDWVLPICDDIKCAKFMMVHGIHDFRWSNFKDRSAYGLARKIWGDIRWPLYFKKNWKNFKKFDAIAQLHEQDFAAQYFRKNGVENQKILYNAVDDDFFEFDGEKKNQIVNVGTYTPRKNQMACLQAFYQANLPDWKLVLIGSSKNGYYEKLLKAKKMLEQKFGKRDVEIKVSVTRKETIRDVCESKIYLLTSISEMFPVSLIEGMAANCAWISTNVGINKYLPGGKICETPQEMAQCLEKFSKSEYWKELAQKGKEFALENCQKEAQVKKLEKILLDAVRKKGVYHD